MLRRILREPLVHFLLGGALLFAVFGRGAPETTMPGKEIVVTSADVERLARTFEQTWRRPPSDEELQKAVNDFIREEVLYRTALSLGLDKDDMVIRRRLRQKMDFLFEDTVSAPQDSDLLAFYTAHRDKFTTDRLISFRQVFIDAKRHEDAEGGARELLQRLASSRDEDIGNVGDPLLLAETYDQMPVTRIAELFGNAFADELIKAEPGKWSGPIKSSFGLHLVRVTSVAKAFVSPFETVRAAVQREWLAQHRAAALDEEYRKLQETYAIHVTYPLQMGVPR